LGTVVRVTHLGNQKQLDVRINDRGPFVRGRIIDLSYGAARKLDIVGPGTAEVEIVALGLLESGAGKAAYRPIDYYSGNFTFQVGAFRERQNAEKLRSELDRTYKNAHIVTFESGVGTFYRVRVGLANSLDQATEYESYLISHGFPDAFAVAE
jgi:rare lipoprotein A